MVPTCPPGGSHRDGSVRQLRAEPGRARVLQGPPGADVTGLRQQTQASRLSGSGRFWGRSNHCSEVRPRWLMSLGACPFEPQLRCSHHPERVRPAHPRSLQLDELEGGSAARRPDAGLLTLVAHSTAGAPLQAWGAHTRLPLGSRTEMAIVGQGHLCWLRLGTTPGASTSRPREWGRGALLGWGSRGRSHYLNLFQLS